MTRTSEPVHVRLVSRDKGPWTGIATCRAGHRHTVCIFPTPGDDWFGRDELYTWAQQHGTCQPRWWIRRWHRIAFLDLMLLAAIGVWVELTWLYAGRLTHDSHPVLFTAFVAWTLMHTSHGSVARVGRWFADKYRTRR